MFNDTIHYEGYWGACPSPCPAHLYFASPMISTDGGSISLRFLSDNVQNFPGWWVQYNIGMHIFSYTIVSLYQHSY